MGKMDCPSVRVLELACPRMSESEAQTINKSSIGRSLNEQQRNSVKGRVLEIDTVIPTFGSFLEDLKYLELLVNALKKLHGPKKSESSFRRSLQCIHMDTQAAERALRELFLYSMRNYYRINAQPSRDSSLKVGEPSDFDGRISEVNEAQLNHFARYAYRLDFRNIWKTSLALIADEEGYDSKERRHPSFVVHKWEAGVRKEDRCGLPKGRSHKKCCAILWIENMEAPNDGQGRDITDFFIRKAVYRAFLDPWEPPSAGKLASSRIVSH